MSAVFAESEVIAEGWRVYEASASFNIADAGTAQRVTDLRGALELHHNLRCEVIHPGAQWPELEHEDNALDIALRWAAEDVKADSEALAAALASLAEQEAGVAA